MADKPLPPDDRAHTALPSAVFGMLTMLVSLAVVAALYVAREIFIPITLAVLLSFLLAPAVLWLHRWRFGRVSAVTLVVFVAFVAILGFAAVVVQEVSSLAQELPNYRYNLEAKVRSLPGLIPGGGVIQRVSSMFRDLGHEIARSETPTSPASGGANETPANATKPIPVQIEQPDTATFEVLKSIIGPLLPPLAASGLVVVFVIMILLDREDLRDRLLRLAGRRDLHRTTEAMDDATHRISRYLRSQLIVNTCCGLPIGLGLTLIGIPNAALWVIMTVVLRFIPYLGIVIAAAFPIALAIAVAPGWGLLIWTILLFVGIELVVSNIVEPWVYGGSTGVSPVALIAAATFWTWLWGPIGLLLSTPVTVCLVVLGRHVPQLQFFDVILGNEPVLTPEETFYQRMLANDPEEATQQAEEFAKEHSLAEFFDEVAIPALLRAQADSDRGALPLERRGTLTTGFRAMLENLADASDEEAVGAGEPRLEVEEPPMVVCVAGRNELDEAAALCLAYLLHLRVGIGKVQVLGADVLAPDNLHLAPLRGVTLVCLSLVSTHSPARARYLLRRIRRRAPQAKVVLGFWGSAPGELAAAEGSVAAPPEIVMSSLRDASAQIEAVLTTETEPARVA